MESAPAFRLNETQATNSISSAFFSKPPPHCYAIQTVAPDYVDRASVQWTFGCLYAIIWIFGIIGNLTVLYMVAERRVNFTVRTVFIVSLACSDLLMGFTSLPVTAVTIFTRIWVFTDFLCYIIGFLQAVSIFVSSFTLIFIAVDRYYLICYPHSVKITYEKARVAIVAFWSFGALLAIPMSAFQRIEELEEGNLEICGRVCVEQWPGSWTWGRRAYGIAVLLLQYALPLILCSLLYAKISFRILKQYSGRLASQSTMSAEFATRSMLRRRRTNRMMAAMVVSFVLTWCPFNLVNLVRDFDMFEYFLHWRYFTLTFAVAHLIAMTSMICNPVIYSWFNYRFRKAVKNFLNNQSNFERTATTLL